MLLPLVVFLFFVALVMGTYVAITQLPRIMAEREMRQRLEDVAPLTADTAGKADVQALVREATKGPAQ